MKTFFIILSICLLTPSTLSAFAEQAPKDAAELLDRLATLPDPQTPSREENYNLKKQAAEELIESYLATKERKTKAIYEIWIEMSKRRPIGGPVLAAILVKSSKYR